MGIEIEYPLKITLPNGTLAFDMLPHAITRPARKQIRSKKTCSVSEHQTQQLYESSRDDCKLLLISITKPLLI